MAANIEIRKINGIDVASFAENGKKERAWHNLGDDQQIFDRPMFVMEALKACHADFKVQMQPVAVLTDDILEAMKNGTQIDASVLQSLLIDNTKATMRTDYNESLGIVSDKYGIVQNEDAFKFVDTLCSGKWFERDNTPVIETCGVLGKGERVFVTAKMPEDIIIDAKHDDRIETYIIFTTSHDGSGAVKCCVTNVRVVCENTLRWALKSNSGMLSLRHGSNIMNRLDLMNTENAEFAMKALNLYTDYETHFKDALEHLKTIKVNETQLDKVIADIALSEECAKIFAETKNIYHEDIKTRGRNIFLGIKEAVHGGIGQDILQTGNALWVMNGITSYYQNNANYKDNETKFNTIMEGNVAKKVQKAYDTLLLAA